MAMTKADIVEIIREKIGLGIKESTEIVEWVFEIMKETLEGGEKIKISGFGNFNARSKHPRKGRNPKTGEAMQSSARRVVRISKKASRAPRSFQISCHPC